MKKYKVSQYAKLNNVTIRTIWNWIKNNKIQIERTTTNGVLVVVPESDFNKTIKIAIYARVSSSENKTNLETQKQRLLNYCSAKGYKITQIITEVGSGLNDTRPKLEKLLLDESVDVIVVEHKDRLARFGLNYIQKLLELNNRRIEITNCNDNDKDDLMQDFVSIITSFTARLYGQRRTKRNTEKLIKQLEQEQLNNTNSEEIIKVEVQQCN